VKISAYWGELLNYWPVFCSKILQPTLDNTAQTAKFALLQVRL
jgi:hypothetical protein